MVFLRSKRDANAGSVVGNFTIDLKFGTHSIIAFGPRTLRKLSAELAFCAKIALKWWRPIDGPTFANRFADLADMRALRPMQGMFRAASVVKRFGQTSVSTFTKATGCQ